MSRTLLAHIASSIGLGIGCFLLFPNPATADTAQETLEEIRALIASKSSEEEAKAIKKITIEMPNEYSGLKNVLAKGKDEAPCIIFDQSAYYILWNVAVASQIAQKIDKAKSTPFFEGYINYLAHFSMFSRKPMDPIQYLKYFGVTDADRFSSRTDAEDVFVFVLHRSLLTFTLAHEIAHHLKGHVGKTSIQQKEARQRETDADAWAAERLIDLGFEPTLATLSLLVLDELEVPSREREDASSHPLPMRRALALLDASLGRISERESSIRQALKAYGTGASTYEQYSEAIKKMRAFYNEALQYELRLGDDADFLMKRAKAGDTKARLRLIDAYTNWTVDGIPIDVKKAAIWSLFIASDENSFDYYNVAMQSYLGGAGTVGSNESLGCHFIKQAFEMGLFYGEFELTRQRSDYRRCG